MQLDIFQNPVFNNFSLTASINKIAYKQGRISELGLFVDTPINTATAVVEMSDNMIQLLDLSPRGVNLHSYDAGERKAVAFVMPVINTISCVKADDVVNLRAFGNQSELETVASMVNDRLAGMRQNAILATVDRMRVSAIQGLVVSARSGNIVKNLYAEFGVTEQVINADFTGTNFDAKVFARQATGYLEDTLAGQPYEGFIAVVGDNFWDQFVTHPSVKDAFARYQEGAWLRSDNSGPAGFEFAGIRWINIRASQGFPANEARIFPYGVNGLFQSILAPADHIDFVGTLGQPFYALQEIEKWGKGIELMVLRSGLEICTQPNLLVKVTMTA